MYLKRINMTYPNDFNPIGIQNNAARSNIEVIEYQWQIKTNLDNFIIKYMLKWLHKLIILRW